MDTSIVAGTDGSILCIECLGQDCDCAEVRTGLAEERHGPDEDGEYPCSGGATFCLHGYPDLEFV